MISEVEAKELYTCIGAAIDGDTSMLLRAYEIAAVILHEVVTAWQWAIGGV